LQQIRNGQAELEASRESAARERLAVLQESEARAVELLEKTKLLVQNNEVPAGELEQLSGNVGEKRASRIAAAQGLFEGQQSLGLAMGLPVERFHEIGIPGDRFPALDRSTPVPDSLANQLLDMALNSRNDLRASRRLESSADSLLNSARNRLKPQVDLVLRAGYTGFESGKTFRNLYAPIYEPLQGMNAMGGLTFEWPFGNNAARGAYAAQDAQYQQTVLRTEDLSRSIRSGVLVALQQIRNGQAELEASRESAARYVAAVENEKRKRTLGISTLIDVLQLEDRLTGARLSNLSAELNISTGLARLRYETGAILSSSGEDDFLSLAQLTTIPQPGGP